MSGIRASSGIPPTLAGSATSPASGQGPVVPTTAAPSAGQGNDLAANGRTPEPASPPARQLPVNTSIEAVVMARTATDHLILHTYAGNFRVTTPIPIPLGSHLTLEIIEAEEVITARLIAINGRDVASPITVRLLPTVDKPMTSQEVYSRIGQFAPTVDKTTLPLMPTRPPATAASPLPATPEPAAPIPRQSSQQSVARMPAPSATPATATAVQAAGMTVTASGGKETPASPFPAAYRRVGEPVTMAPSSGGAVPAASIAANKAAAMEQNLRPPIVNAEVLRAHASPLPLFPAAGKIAEGATIPILLRPDNAGAPLSHREGVYQGTVIAIARAADVAGVSRVTLQTPLGVIAVNSALPPSIGTIVEFAIADEIALFPLPDKEIRAGGERPPRHPLTADWATLREALNHVAHTDPVVAQNAFSQIIPQANARLPANLLFFIVALGFGSVDRWLGPDFSNALRSSSRGDLLKVLDDDFKSLARLQSDAGGQDWKSLSFPFFDGSNLRQVRMFYRRHGNPADEERPETTRFVIDLNLTRSGPVQLDGLFKLRELNLAIRSHNELPETMRLDINRIFTDHMSISGLKGLLTFRTGAPFPIAPEAEWEMPRGGATMR